MAAFDVSALVGLRVLLYPEFPAAVRWGCVSSVLVPGRAISPEEMIQRSFFILEMDDGEERILAGHDFQVVLGLELHKEVERIA